MAIDSSIPLQGLGAQSTPVSAADTMGKWANLAQIGQGIEASKQSVEASKASQALTEAQLPGAQADSAVKQRALAFNDWIAKNRKLYTNPDGSLNTRALNAAATAAGFQSEGAAIGAADLKNTADMIRNATDEQTKNIATDKFTTDGVGYTATYLKSLPAIEQAAALGKIVAYKNSLIPGSGDQMINMFGNIDPETGKVTIDEKKIDAAREATMTPLEKENLLLSQRQMSVTERSQTLAEKTADPAYKAQVADIRTAEERVKQAEQAANASTVVAGIDQALAAARSPSIAALDGRPGAIIANTWNALVGSDGNAAAIEKEISAYNLRNGTNLSVPKDGYIAVQKALANDRVNISNRAAIAAKQSQAATATQATSPETNTPPNPVQPAAPAAKTVTMAHVQEYATRNKMKPAAVIEMLKGKGIQVTK